MSIGMSDFWLSHIAPRGAVFEHGVEYDQQFAHARDERHLLRLAGCQQLLVEVADDRVVTAGYHRSHIQGGSYSGAPAPDGPFAPQGAAIAVEGSHSHQGGYLPAIQRSQLRQVGQQSEGNLFPHAGNGAQEVILLSPHGAPA